MATVKKIAKLPGVKDISSGNRINPKGWGYYIPLPGVRYYVYINEGAMNTPKSADSKKGSGAL